MRRTVRLVLALVLLAAAGASGQAVMRRLATITALHQFPGFYHLQDVLLRGELVARDRQILLRADDGEIRVLLKDATIEDGPVEVRGQMIDVGRLQPDDPRVIGFAEPGSPEADPDRWPRPGEVLVVSVSSITSVQPATTPTIRALSLEPWKFEGQSVTVIGNFHGRNLFGDLGGAPGRSRYDFVLRGSEGAVWVTGMRPRGKDFDLDIDRRVDTDKWLKVTGTVRRDRGLVLIDATQVALAKEPEDDQPVEEDAAPRPPLLPAEVVFSAPTADETGVAPTTTVRIQFSRGLKESTIAGHLSAGYAGAAMPIEFTTAYDAATRSIEMKFPTPLTPFRTVTVQTLEGLQAFDGAPVTPWALTFSISGTP
jgi:hypothetical protein